MVEQYPLKVTVGGSNPPRLTNYLNYILLLWKRLEVRILPGSLENSFAQSDSKVQKQGIYSLHGESFRVHNIKNI